MKLRRSRWSRVQILLDAPLIPSDGGLVLLKETEERAGLLPRVGSLLKDSPRRKNLKHAKDKMLSQRGMAICQGWEGCNDFNEPRKDPLYSLAL